MAVNFRFQMSSKCPDYQADLADNQS
jgi:hypothetical protein